MLCWKHRRTLKISYGNIKISASHLFIGDCNFFFNFLLLFSKANYCLALFMSLIWYLKVSHQLFFDGSKCLGNISPEGLSDSLVFFFHWLEKISSSIRTNEHKGNFSSIPLEISCNDLHCYLTPYSVCF